MGVDQVTGTYNFALTEGEIGPAVGGVSLVRTWGQSGWRDNWSGDLRQTVEGSTQVITIIFGGVSQRFTLQGSTWVPANGNGASLSVVTPDLEWVYRTADNTAITYKSPLALVTNGAPTTIDMPSIYCNSSNALTCGVPVSIVRPDGANYTLTWHTPQQCIIADEIPEDGSNGDSCTATYRLTDVRSASGYAMKIKYESNQDATGTWGNQSAPPPGWFRRTNYKFLDLAQVQCAATALNCDGVAGTWPTVSYAYPSAGVFEVINTQSGTTRVTVSGPNVTAVRRPGATTDTTVVTYDGSNRVTAITSDGASNTYAWTVSGSTVTAVATDVGAGGGTTTTVTDTSVGRPTSVTNATGNTVTLLYDSARRVTRETRPEGDYTEFTYDSRGNVTQTRIVAKPGSGLADIVTTASYPTTCPDPDTCNQPLYTIDALGNRTDYTYDATHGQVTRVQLPAPTTGGTRPEINYSYTQLQAQVMGPSGLVNSGQPQWRVTQITSCATAATCAGSANETKVTITYSTTNNLNVASVTTAAGNGSISSTQSYTYNQHDRVIAIDGPLSGPDDTTHFIWDVINNRQVGVIGPDPDGTGPRLRVAERYTHDSASRVIKVDRGTVTGTDGISLAAISVAQSLDVVYNADGQRIRETASSGGTTFNVVQYSYDAQRRLLCTALRMNPATWSSLPSDACTAATAGSDGPDRITRNSYDANDRVIKVETDLATGTPTVEATTAYTANGLVDYVADGMANRTTYIYDGHNRLVQTRYPVTTVGSNASNANDKELLAYDAGGRVIQRTLRDGQTITLSYDNLGRLIGRNMPGSDPDTSMAYDLAGRLTTATDTTGRYAGFAYDALGRMTAQSSNQGVLGMAYDAAGRRTMLVYPDNFYVNYDYDVVGNVLTIRENGATSGIGVLATYSYDNLGRRSNVAFGNGTSQALTFDNADRLTTLTTNLANTAHDVETSFAYNSASQIASQTRNNDSYAWNGHYNVDRSSSIDGLNRIMVNGLTTIGYDGRGNLTSSGASTYTYNADNLMLTAPNGVTLGWDPLGRMAQLATTTATTRFAYDGVNLIAEYNASNVLQRRYVHGPGSDQPIVWYEGSGTTDRRWLHADERGSIVSVSNASGAALIVNSYDEYGIPAASNLGRFQYTGQTWLPEIGLYHYKARMYSPTLGRFMQTDPIGYADGMNWYAYVGNDPVNYVDPLGLNAWGEVENPRSTVRNICFAYDISNDCGAIKGSEGNDDIVVNGFGGPLKKSIGPCGGILDRNPVDGTPEPARQRGARQGRPGYHSRTGGAHAGVDIRGGVGTAVRATGDGIVVRSDTRNITGYGGQVVINHGSGIFTVSAHISDRIAAGESVSSGDIIGYIARPVDGATVDDGNLNADFDPHVHFEIRTPDNIPERAGRVTTIDPALCLPNLDF